MSEETGFQTMGRASGGGEIAPIGVGMLVYAFMGKAHANAYKTLAYMAWPPPLLPRLVAIAGRDAEAVGAAAQRYGFERAVTDWRGRRSPPEGEPFPHRGAAKKNPP